MMAILKDHLNGETAQWLDLDDVDINHNTAERELLTPGAASSLMGIIREWTDTPWKDI